jgi:subtilisin family serine protease
MRLVSVILAVLGAVCILTPASATQEFRSTDRQRVIVEFSMPQLDFLRDEAVSGDVTETIIREQISAILQRTLPETRLPTADQQPAFDAPQLVRMYRYTPVAVMRLNALERTRLARDISVRGIRADGLDFPSLDTSVPTIGADIVHQAGRTGAGTAIAVLDTGVDLQHDMFAGRIAASACFSTTDEGFSESLCPGGVSVDTTSPEAGDNCEDASGGASARGCDHGTHVAGIALGGSITDPDDTERQLTGVAPGAGLVAVQVFSRFEESSVCGASSPCVASYNSDSLAALEWIYDNRATLGVSAINMSLGANRFEESCPDDIRAEIIGRLRDAGILTVIAAGNSRYSDAVNSPGCVPEAITVSADASFSNVSFLSDISAPGSGITSAIPGVADEAGSTIGVKSGTSMSTPHVAGAIALLRAAFPNASVDQIESAIEAAVMGDDVLSGALPRDIRVDLTADIIAPNETGALGPITVNSLTPFNAVRRKSALAAAPFRDVILENTGSTTVDWEISSPAAWLTIEQIAAAPSGLPVDAPLGVTGNLSAGQSASVRISVDDADLEPGIYRTAIWLESSASTGRLPVSVTLRLLAPIAVNNPFAQALEIGSDVGQFDFDLANSDTETGEPAHGGFPPNETIWWRYTPQQSGFFSFSVNANFNPVIAAYTGTNLSDLTALDSDFDDGDGSAKLAGISIPVEAGTTYHIAVGSLTAGTGADGVAAYRFSGEPSNDDVENAIPLSGARGMVRMFGGGATRSDAESGFFGASQPAVWYRWVVPQTGTYAIYSLQSDAPVYAFNDPVPSTESSIMDYGPLDEPFSGGTVTANADDVVYIASYAQNSGPTQFDIGWRPTEASSGLRAALLPSARSIEIGESATVFVTVVNPAGNNADFMNCRILPQITFNGVMHFQQTDPATNGLVGIPNQPANIASGQSQSFAIFVTPASVMAEYIEPTYVCDGAWTGGTPIYQNPNVFGLFLSASETETADIIPIAATASGDGITTGTSDGVAAFAIAAVNVGARGIIEVSPRYWTSDTDVALEICQTNPLTGACLGTRDSWVAVEFARNEVRTFSVFVRFNGTDVPLRPATHRVYVDFKPAEGPSSVIRGSTSVAVQTQ